MSIVADQVRRIDGELDKLQLGKLEALSSRPQTASHDEGPAYSASVSPKVDLLQTTIRALSTTSSSSPLLSPWRIAHLLNQAGLSATPDFQDNAVKSPYETELEWMLVSKATVQTYGLILNTLLEQTIPISDEIWYWDEVLGSYAYSGLYAIQTSPLRLWSWSKDIFYDTKLRAAQLRQSATGAVSPKEIGANITLQWKQFYSLVQESIRERSVADIQRRVFSPVALCRAEARRKQASLRALREMSASGLGVLVDEGLTFDIEDEESGSEWKGIVERSVALISTVLCNITALETGVSEFEETVFASVHDDPEISAQDSESALSNKPAKVAGRLHHILASQVPEHIATQRKLTASYGRPSRIIRYWLPATALLLSSSTILRIVVNRKADIIQWFQDFGATVRDFWMNWVVDPTRKVINTIRHDKDSEVAIMSKESLKGDRDSLERMVVDFAIDNPAAAGLGSTLSEAQIADIRAKVKEGDLTPVLRAYEQDLRKPFMGTVRGDLVRTLLIQVQKTKVDVEVALSGIDSLLKSQELVIGFVGLTPGVLVTWAVFRYLGGMFGGKTGQEKGKRAGECIRTLRNIDRILSLSTPTESGILNYKDHGLLLCEVHVLRSRAHKLFPGHVEREFLEDVNELADIRIGVARQLGALKRIRWAYSAWLYKY